MGGTSGTFSRKWGVLGGLPGINLGPWALSVLLLLALYASISPLMKNMFKTSGVTLIEMLIVITIIGVLAATIAKTLGAIGGVSARDAGRIHAVQQIATMLSSLQNRYHVPPLTNRGKYPPDCKTSAPADLFKCFKAPTKDLLW